MPAFENRTAGRRIPSRQFQVFEPAASSQAIVLRSSSEVESGAGFTGDEVADDEVVDDGVVDGEFISDEAVVRCDAGCAGIGSAEGASPSEGG